MQMHLIYVFVGNVSIGYNRMKGCPEVELIGLASIKPQSNLYTSPGWKDLQVENAAKLLRSWTDSTALDEPMVWFKYKAESHISFCLRNW